MGREENQDAGLDRRSAASAYLGAGRSCCRFRGRTFCCPSLVQTRNNRTTRLTRCVRRGVCAAMAPLWGAPRIHGELLNLGFGVSQRTVARLMPRRPKPPSQTWRTFLQNHLADLVSVDFFVVPTATFRVLYVFVVLMHHRRQVVHFNVTDSPTAAWTAQQIVDAFPDDNL